MPQKIGIVVDATCDLPRSFLDQHGVEIMPINLRAGTISIKDTRDPEKTSEVYRRYLGQKNIEIGTAPMSVNAIRDWFLDQLVLKYDRVLVITGSSTRSDTFKHAQDASFKILSEYKERRKNAGLDEQFNLRVVDSKTLFTGLGVVVHEALRALKGPEEVLFDKLRQHVENFAPQVRAYLVPQDLYYVRTRASQKGEKSVGWLSYQMGSMLDVKPVLEAYRGETTVVAKVRGFDSAVQKLFQMAIEAIETGLLAKVMCMSYGGNPEEVKALPGYDEFIKCAQANRVETLLSVMSATAGVHVGPGAFSLAYAA